MLFCLSIFEDSVTLTYNEKKEKGQIFYQVEENYPVNLSPYDLSLTVLINIHLFVRKCCYLISYSQSPGNMAKLCLTTMALDNFLQLKVSNKSHDRLNQYGIN
jgi:hypothetical protein